MTFYKVLGVILGDLSDRFGDSSGRERNENLNQGQKRADGWISRDT